MNANEKYNEQVIELVKKYDEANKKEVFVNGLTNYEKHILTTAIEYRKMFPETWEEKVKL